MKIMEYVRHKMQSFLQVNPPLATTINLQEYLDWEGNCIKNRIWYRGDGAELEQLYWQLVQSPTQKQMFWASHPTPGIEMRKIHTGLPAMIVDMLTDIVTGALNQITIISESDEVQKRWDDIAEDADIKSVVEQSIKDTLVIGDGAFKISIDPELKFPIIEFWSGDKVDYRTRHGRIKEIVFKSIHKFESGTYELKEIYGRGYVDYELYKAGEPIELTIDPQFAGLVRTEWDTDMMLAVPCKVYESARWPGRGQSVYDRKIDAFDSFDEAYSQWIDALRTGRTKTYIPESLVPRNPRTGKPRTPNAFDNRYIMTDTDMRERAVSEIHTDSSDIPYQSYAATYAAALELCLLRLLSPSTLGIDIKKLDNAEAQREKEKVTLYTRDAIVEALQPILEKVVRTALDTSYMMHGEEVPPYTVQVTFQSYANPSFESQIETVAKGRAGGVMSIEACVDELYGDSRDDEWKAAEVARLKAEKGIPDGKTDVGENRKAQSDDAAGASGAADA